MDASHRKFFDKQVDWVLKRLPSKIHELLEVVPMYVEDYPSKKLMRELHIKERDELCGCFVGKTVEQWTLDTVGSPSFIALFREALFAQALDAADHVDLEQLRKEIRITILHELAHYHGIDEEELEALGYA